MAPISSRPEPDAPDARVDVVVVGGGPTGMTVAGDLARAGRAVAVLERWPRINPASRAFMTMARTLEVLDARGLADGLLSTASTTDAVHLFAGATLDLSRLRSPYPFGMVTPQTNVDQALARYAHESGADIHRGVEVAGLSQDDLGVTVTARPKDAGDDAHLRSWRASYVVAADGAHSTVRELLGLDFPGRAVLSSVVLADVRLTAGPQDGGLTLGNTPDEFAFLVPYGRPDADGGAWFRSMTWDRRHQLPDTAPVERAEITEVLARAMGRDVGVVDVAWRSRFHCDERQIERYRVGRVLLAGDAAHVHSPMGGQGMNTGIQDAANLSWKLDGALGGATDAVLDSYHAERHPIGRRVLRQSGLMMRAVTLHPAPARFLRDRLGTRLLALPSVRDRVAGSFAGTELRYAAPAGADDAVGRIATPVPLEGEPLSRLQRSGGFVLVRAAGEALGRAGVEVPRATATAGVRVTRRRDPGPALLVRPDGYVAWAGARSTPDVDAVGAPYGWAEALARWTAPSRHLQFTTA